MTSMADRKGGFSGFRLVLILILVGVAVWFGRKGWTEAVCPGEEEVIRLFVESLAVPAEDDWTTEDITGYWADDKEGTPLQVGAWEFRARNVFLRFGSMPPGMDADERILLSYRGLEEMEGERLILSAKPVTFFGRLRMFVHEIGRDMSIPEPGSKEEFGVWVAPDR